MTRRVGGLKQKYPPLAVGGGGGYEYFLELHDDQGFVADTKPERQNEAEDLGVNYQNSEKRIFKWCLRCSKDYDLAECEQFQTDEIQARWDI